MGKVFYGKSHSIIKQVALNKLSLLHKKNFQNTQTLQFIIMNIKIEIIDSSY
jgi:hypothetical protein